MQIERLNNIQFWCVLSKQDVAVWNLDFNYPDRIIEEMQDIICACLEQAHEEIGFVVEEESAITLDVVPLTSEVTILIFTKIPRVVFDGNQDLTGRDDLALQITSDSFTRIIVMNSLNNVLNVAYRLDGVYSGLNTLYKDEETGDYYLLLNKSKHSEEEFTWICDIVGEYEDYWVVEEFLTLMNTILLL